MVIKPNAPKTYTVQKGDTLWDIAGKFLEHPWQWSRLWQDNAQIKNPHRIYPSDILSLLYIDHQPRLNLSRNIQRDVTIQAETCRLNTADYEHGRQTILLDKSGKVLPCVRESVLEQPIHLIPQAKIAAFLTSPKIVTQEEFEAAPYVVGFQNGHLIAGASDKIYVQNLTTTSSEHYTVYRQGESYQSANEGGILGIEARYIASATREDDNNPASLIVTKSAREIRIGDRIMPASDIEYPLNFFPEPPSEPIEARIMGLFDGVALAGLHSVVVIDKGSADGLTAGHELAVYQTGQKTLDPLNENSPKISLPDEIAGRIMVFRAFEHLSYALVMNANHDIRRFDKVKTR
jgi:hypothetical protein